MRNPETPAEGSSPDPEEPVERTIDQRGVRPSAAWNLSVIMSIAAADDAAAAAEAAAAPALPASEGALPHCAPHDGRPHEHQRRALRKGPALARGEGSGKHDAQVQ
ncbi:hypothetical protein ACIPY5_14855 [Microbacterium sp. NPDC089698]|uniref:hypothetical protein n=1 Tax=Microbacterium sp. NPDC089698 TaxID=3364200 RepID=UPI0038227F1A